MLLEDLHDLSIPILRGLYSLSHAIGLKNDFIYLAAEAPIIFPCGQITWNPLLVASKLKIWREGVYCKRWRWHVIRVDICAWECSKRWNLVRLIVRVVRNNFRICYEYIYPFSRNKFRYVNMYDYTDDMFTLSVYNLLFWGQFDLSSSLYYWISFMSHFYKTIGLLDL